MLLESVCRDHCSARVLYNVLCAAGAGVDATKVLGQTRVANGPNRAACRAAELGVGLQRRVACCLLLGLANRKLQRLDEYIPRVPLRDVLAFLLLAAAVDEKAFARSFDQLSLVLSIERILLVDEIEMKKKTMCV